MNDTSALILSQFPPSVRKLAGEVRIFIHALLPGIDEQPDFPARMIAYGYGPGYKDSICTLLLSQKGVKLGFYKGAELPDPQLLLTGTGKIHRYVEIRSVKSLNSALRSLMNEALEAYKKRSS